MMNNGATTNTGVVYIYEKDSTTNKWTEKMLLQPPTGIEGNEFGKKIGFSDDDELLAVVSSKMIFVYQKADVATSVEQQYQALLFNSGPWIEFRSIGSDIVANFDGGVAIIADEFDSSLYTIYGKDDGGHVVALDVSFFGVVQSHPVSPFHSL